MERPRLLNHMALYKRVYAVGRCAIEAKILGCEILPYDSRFPDPSIWVVLDNSEVIPMLQKELDKLEVKNGSNVNKSKRKYGQASKEVRKTDDIDVLTACSLLITDEVYKQWKEKDEE